MTDTSGEPSVNSVMNPLVTWLYKQRLQDPYSWHASVTVRINAESPYAFLRKNIFTATLQRVLACKISRKSQKENYVSLKP